MNLNILLNVCYETNKEKTQKKKVNTELERKWIVQHYSWKPKSMSHPLAAQFNELLIPNSIIFNKQAVI